jgi:hypothetical protein
MKVSKRQFKVMVKSGKEVSFKTPSYDKLLPLFKRLSGEVEGLDELDMMMYMAKKCIPLFWADEEEMDAEDPIGSLQDMDLDLEDIVKISAQLFEKIKEQVEAISKAQEAKN